MSDFERVDNEIICYKDSFSMYIDLFLETHKQESINNQSQWYACLSYIYNNLFKPVRNLRDNRKCNIPYTDIDSFEEILDAYIYYCNVYERMVTIEGFLNLTGMESDTLYRYSNGDTDLNCRWKVIYKKLDTNRQMGIDGKLWDSKNVTGQLGLANHYYGYNLPGVSKEVSRDSIATSQLPSFSLECNNDPNE